MKNEYKNLLNEMIPNAERFGSRMDLARHQAQRVKKVIDAHNADVDFKSLKNQGASEVAPWHEKELAGRAERIKSIAQAHGANLGFKGNPSTRQSVYSKTQPSEVKLAQLDYKGKPEVTVDFSRLSDEQRQQGQKKADELRKTGLADRKVKARQEAQSREKARISNAFTFESMQIDETSKASMKNEYKNLLNEMMSNKSRFGERKALAIHQAGRVRKMLDAHSKSMFGNPAAGSPENMGKLERLNLMARSQGADTAVKNAVIVAPKDGKTIDAYPNLVPVGPGSKVNFAALGDEDRIKSQRRLDSIRRGGLKTRRNNAMMARHKAALDARAQEFTME